MSLCKLLEELDVLYLSCDHLPGLVSKAELDNYLNYLSLWLIPKGSPLTAVVKQEPVSGFFDYVQNHGFGHKIITSDSGPEEPVISSKFDWTLLEKGLLYSNYPQGWYKKPLVTHKTHQRVYSKAELHLNSREYGIPVFDGGVAYDFTSLKKLICKLQLTNREFWLKREDGSGSDYAHLCNSSSDLTLILSSLFDNTWQDGPFSEPIVLEEDASTSPLFEALNNYCITGFISLNGDRHIIGITQQIIKETTARTTEWCGSISVTPNDEEYAAIEESFGMFCQYLYKQDYVGPVGPDMYTVGYANGKVEAKVFDPNCRLPISAYSWSIAQEKKYPCFTNINMTLPFEVINMEEIKKLYKSPNVIYLTLRSTPEAPSPIAKVFIGGENPQEINRIIKEMKKKGVIVGV